MSAYAYNQNTTPQGLPEEKKLVYLIEDDPDLQNVLSRNLDTKGFKLQCFPSAEEAIHSLGLPNSAKPSAVIVDVNLAGNMNGFEAVNFFRSEKSFPSFPILMLTAKSGNPDIVSGLNQGADDYLPKPFDLDVLVARLNSIIRRTQNAKGVVVPFKQKYQLCGIEVDPTSHEVFIESKKIDLTPTEFDILQILMSKPNQVLERDDLLLRILGPNKTVTSRTIDVHIKALRTKIGEKAKHVTTVRGLGYKFIP